jgi:hypothetical protein
MKALHAETMPPPSVPPPRLDPAWDVACACSYGHFPWDDWERWALSRGLHPDIAGQARLLIREWFNHSWDECLRQLCGWSDDGRALLQFGLKSPKKSLRQWDILMRTDGLRGDAHPRTKEWTWGYLRPDAERLLSTLNR